MRSGKGVSTGMKTTKPKKTGIVYRKAKDHCREYKFQQMEQALRIIRTWGAFDEDCKWPNDPAMKPAHIINLCDEALNCLGRERSNMQEEGLKLERMEVSAAGIGKVIADVLQKKYNGKIRFCLLIASNEIGWFTHVSNVQRESTIELLKDAIEKISKEKNERI